jgi:uncharacterized protein (DUF427 family)
LCCRHAGATVGAVRTSRSDKWVRGFVGEVAVVDSREPLLVWEEGAHVPGYVFARADVRTDLLRPSAGPAPLEPRFFLPKGAVAQWFDLEVDGRALDHAAWSLAAPEVADLVGFSWEPGVFDRWLEEDEEVRTHPRDPFKRVEALPSSRHITVALDGVPLADTRRPVLLFETNLPTRYYLPLDDVNLAALTASSNETRCPYKGLADGYWDSVGPPGRANIAWSYSNPFPAVASIAGLVAFYNELVDITIDEVAVPRPRSIFSE